MRGWPEYVRSSAEHRAKRIAILGNSQAVGREIGDEQLLYSAQLQGLFKLNNVPVTVENWSVEGLSSDQIELLSMQAARRAIDLMVVIISPSSIDLSSHYRLGSQAPDVDLLAGSPLLWPLLSDAGFYPKLKYHDLLRRAVTLNSNTARSRVDLLDRLATTVPIDRHPFVFGQVRPIRAWRRIDVATGRNDSTRNAASRPAPAYRGPQPAVWNRELMKLRLPTFNKFYPALHARLKTHGVKLVWIWMPLSQPVWGPVIKEAATPFFAEICKKIHASGINCVDLNDALPDRAFRTPDVTSHLTVEGHRLAAERLYPLLRDAIY